MCVGGGWGWGSLRGEEKPHQPRQHGRKTPQTPATSKAPGQSFPAGAAEREAAPPHPSESKQSAPRNFSAKPNKKGDKKRR